MFLLGFRKYVLICFLNRLSIIVAMPSKSIVCVQYPAIIGLLLLLFLLLFLEKKSDTQKSLGVILEMLDFACWRSNLDVWKCLKAIIQKLQIQYV